MKYLIKLYRTCFSENTRKTIYHLFLKDLLYLIRNFDVLFRAKATYYLFPLFPKTEKNSLFRFMGKYGLTAYPWLFVSEYDAPANCFYDKEKSMFYVVHNQKKLYFPRHFTKSEVQNLYRSLLIEQDLRSPHRYLENYSVLKRKVVLDLGAAEGLFSLNAIDLIQHSYLFECEEYWVEALEATFAPWKEKITIIPLYISDVDSKTTITIDTFLQDKLDVDIFIKMDIEGVELRALQGGIKTLTNRTDVLLSVCTYHTPYDAEQICAFLSSLDYIYTFTEGYLFFQKHLNKVILRAEKRTKLSDNIK